MSAPSTTMLPPPGLVALVYMRVIIFTILLVITLITIRNLRIMLGGWSNVRIWIFVNIAIACLFYIVVGSIDLARLFLGYTFDPDNVSICIGFLGDDFLLTGSILVLYIWSKIAQIRETVTAETGSKRRKILVGVAIGMIWLRATGMLIFAIVFPLHPQLNFFRRILFAIYILFFGAFIVIYGSVLLRRLQTDSNFKKSTGLKTMTIFLVALGVLIVIVVVEQILVSGTPLTDLTSAWLTLGLGVTNMVLYLSIMGARKMRGWIARKLNLANSKVSPFNTTTAGSYTGNKTTSGSSSSSGEATYTQTSTSLQKISVSESN
eukprot:TRINITY_DN5727_c0_g2_i2.p1 TRINITY_DN5727_c0_g2~~TRINITY_DN5727_c0_g2_i2.p1  ORF type:complete len:320 (+),score=45.56 TRINITY_DN5727_c0_g2_i2:127-1086(+)